MYKPILIVVFYVFIVSQSHAQHKFINPAILEPVIQIGKNIKLQYSPKPKEEIAKPVVKTEVAHKYYVVSPNGTIDVRILNTNK